ncbi:hypothetical protein [Paraglaciecola sp. L3A3]|uniref:hypothetical protein n=1 Tax=Paraglaciecola sp. L3A3 TaxID=2686358 RepID=UPI00131D4FC1|nr:hypothetical protein [Paraglaciecola sp. L3A3]
MTNSAIFKHTTRMLSAIFMAVVISACSSTQSSAPVVKVINQQPDYSYYQSIDTACEQQAIEMDGYAQRSGQPAQYLASAKAMLRCVNGIQFPKGHPDTDKGLRLMALSVMNFVKGGDINAASVALRKTQSTFPDRDLYFADYSSFMDTAKALLNQQKMSRQQLAALNISPDLRAEIERNQYWLRH